MDGARDRRSVTGAGDSPDSPGGHHAQHRHDQDPVPRARAALHAATRGGRPEPPVHFHQGPAGEPAPCFDEACMRPRMTV